MTLRLFQFAVLVFAFVAASACGVKGDPLPPERPAELGRGRPTYKRAAERVKVVPTVEEETDEEDDDAEGE